VSSQEFGTLLLPVTFLAAVPTEFVGALPEEVAGSLEDVQGTGEGRVLGGGGERVSLEVDSTGVHADTSACKVAELNIQERAIGEEGAAELSMSEILGKGRERTDGNSQDVLLRAISTDFGERDAINRNRSREGKADILSREETQFHSLTLAEKVEAFNVGDGAVEKGDQILL
jgi:hypothetical protein